MDFRDTPEEARFRLELREWIEANLPRGWRERPPNPGRADNAVARAWSRKVYEAGYAGITWPPEYGGAGRPHTYQAIFIEESARAEAPEHIGVIGLGMAGPTIIAHGTEQQKNKHLKKILSAEEVWCQGFSEPESGSDLASLKTRAERDGDHFVVNGQKVWSSFAEIADYCILLTRTDPEAPKHRGITYMLVDMRSPGIEVRPLKQITGEPEFNEIFFSNVRVPVSGVLGEVNEGWTAAMTTLMHERGTFGFSLTARLEVLVRKLMQLAQDSAPDGCRAADDPLIADRIAQLWIELQALRFTNYRSLTKLMETGVPGPEGSIPKLHWSESNQRLTKLALEILGAYNQLDGEGSFWNGFWQYQQLRSRGNTIEAGTSEVLRNIISERVLGLPRSR
ncbi:MAG TPA: acyl-CoA dehydrogenase [Actinomycetota bacterium]|jgi:alkylation response protein AidB-like acyl-CoA dehydrogenase|nr:acyl-CoA dehydrogenase [Actinomycetota bacterium]